MGAGVFLNQAVLSKHCCPKHYVKLCVGLGSQGCPNLQHIDLQFSRGRSATNGLRGIQLVLALVVVVAGRPSLQHIDLS